MPRSTPPEFKARALKLLEERFRAQQCPAWDACTVRGISPHTIRFPSGVRPSCDEIIAFIDMHRDRFGVETICPVLSTTECEFITFCGYHAVKRWPERRRIHAENYSVYGVGKMRQAMDRAEGQIGRDQVARLMKKAGVQGVHRGRKPITTRPASERHVRPVLRTKPGRVSLEIPQ